MTASPGPAVAEMELDDCVEEVLVECVVGPGDADGDDPHATAAMVSRVTPDIHRADRTRIIERLL
jgi:hypothetical protein